MQDVASIVEYDQVIMDLNLGSDSRYTNATVFAAGEDLMLNTFHRPEYNLTSEDIKFTVTGELQYRLDLISMKFYGTPHLWWLIAYANSIVDPFTEVIVGLRLVIPPRGEVDNRG